MRLNREDIKTVLKACGITNTVEKNDNLIASFPGSNMSVFFRDKLKNTTVLTDGMEEKQWIIGSRMTFRYVIANYDQCEMELREFVEKLAALKEVFFVVAFQYEGIRAIRDQEGLKFVE